MADGQPARTTATAATISNCSAFDHSAANAEHLHNFLLPAIPGLSGHFSATNQLFGTFYRTLRQRSCEPRFAASDLLERQT
jgi:hypothetical protein